MQKNYIISIGGKMKKTLLLICIALLIILFSTFRLLITKNTTNKLIKEENSEYEYYLDKTIYGTELTTIINKTINKNENNGIQKDEKNYYIENDENSIKIEIKMITTDKTYPMEEIYNNDITKFVQNFNLIKFKCTSIEYHEKTGKIKKIVFEQMEY